MFYGYGLDLSDRICLVSIDGFDSFFLIWVCFSTILTVTKVCYRSMGTTGDPDRPVTGSDRITLSPARAGTGEPLHRLDPVPVRVFTGTGSPVGRFSK